MCSDVSSTQPPNDSYVEELQRIDEVVTCREMLIPVTNATVESRRDTRDVPYSVSTNEKNGADEARGTETNRLNE